MSQSRFSLILVLLLSLTVCASRQQKQSQFKWGQTLKIVKENEQERLGQQPFSLNSFSKTDVTSAVYEDKHMSSRCYLTYWFDLDSLQIVSYSCSNPDWDEAELKRYVTQKLTALYGQPQWVKLGEKSYEYYRAKDAYIYFRMTRIPQDREFWRTFQANIFYSHFSHEDYNVLSGLLATFGRK